MTPLTWLWLASTLGACLFFVGGVLVARPARTRARHSTRPPPLTDHATYNAILEHVAARRDVRGIALADEMGLPIASLGEHAEALAAFSGVLIGGAARARHFLPCGTLRRVVVEDVDGATITTFPHDEARARFALVCLTAGPGPEPSEVSDALSTSAGLIGAASLDASSASHANTNREGDSHDHGS